MDLIQNEQGIDNEIGQDDSEVGQRHQLDIGQEQRLLAADDGRILSLLLALVDLDLDPDDDVQQNAGDFHKTIDCQRSLEVLRRIYSGADVVAQGLPRYDEVPGQLGDDPKTLDPDVDEEAPEVILKGCRVSKPEHVGKPRLA